MCILSWEKKNAGFDLDTLYIIDILKDYIICWKMLHILDMQIK